MKGGCLKFSVKILPFVLLYLSVIVCVASPHVEFDNCLLDLDLPSCDAEGCLGEGGAIGEVVLLPKGYLRMPFGFLINGQGVSGGSDDSISSKLQS